MGCGGVWAFNRIRNERISKAGAMFKSKECIEMQQEQVEHECRYTCGEDDLVMRNTSNHDTQTSESSGKCTDNETVKLNDVRYTYQTPKRQDK